jgi:hypothetical protein
VNNFLVSLIRTAVPVVVGWLAVQALKVGIELDPGATEGFIYPLVITAYYTAARALEKKWPALGYLLGIPKEPNYPTA